MKLEDLPTIISEFAKTIIKQQAQIDALKDEITKLEDTLDRDQLDVFSDELLCDISDNHPLHGYIISE